MTVFTAIVFLNLSFFMAEVTAIKLNHQNRQLVENLVKALSGISEEERDAPTGAEGGDAHKLIKEIVDLVLLDHSRSLSNEFTLIHSKYADIHNNIPRSGIFETPIQPPEA